MNRVDAPVGLQAMDVAVANDQLMRPEHVVGVCDWIHEFMARNVYDPVPVKVEEIHLIAKALADALEYAERLGHRFATATTTVSVGPKAPT